MINVMAIGGSLQVESGKQLPAIEYTEEQDAAGETSACFLALDGALQGLIQRSLRGFVFLRGNLALKAIGFESEELLLHGIQQVGLAILWFGLGRSSLRGILRGSSDEQSS